MHEGLIVRRRSDGSIDFDRYRAEAAALRQQAIQGAFSLKAPGKLKAIVVVMAGGVIAACSLAYRFAAGSDGPITVSMQIAAGNELATSEGVRAFARHGSAR